MYLLESYVSSCHGIAFSLGLFLLSINTDKDGTSDGLNVVKRRLWLNKTVFNNNKGSANDLRKALQNNDILCICHFSFPINSLAAFSDAR